MKKCVWICAMWFFAVLLILKIIIFASLIVHYQWPAWLIDDMGELNIGGAALLTISIGSIFIGAIAMTAAIFEN